MGIEYLLFCPFLQEDCFIFRKVNYNYMQTLTTELQV